MKDQEINIAIAEACGWKICQSCLKNGYHTWRTPDDKSCKKDLPNYTGDLNAMHEAEETLEPILNRKRFPEYLAQVMSKKEGFRSNGLPLPQWWVVHVNPRQRAEAFLRTIGKWKD